MRVHVAMTPNERKIEAWSKRCPHNFQPKAELVRSEIEWLAGCYREAHAGYTSAAASADTYGYVHVASLAQLQAARMHARRREIAERDRCLVRARDGFTRWGASALLDHPDLLELKI